ncbi:MAG: hypothetical protein Roseis2KO_16370 [Roseivirga sp.]
MDKMVTVATFHLPQDAYIIRGRLESDGIFCYLKDELTVQSDNIISNAIGGVKLQVHESDVKQALPILEELGLIEREFVIGHHAPNKGLPKELRFVLITGAAISTIILVYYFFFS